LKLVTSRDIKNNPNILFDDEQSEIIITSRGRPRAICIPIDEEEQDGVDELFRSIQQVRAKRSFEKVRAYILAKSDSRIYGDTKIQEIVDDEIAKQGRLF